MNATIVSKENTTVKFTFEVGPEKLEEGLQHSYLKNRSKFNVPGFRKGKAPRKIIEASYGEGVLLDDAINYILYEEYDSAVKELDLDIVSRPEIDIPKLDRAEGVTFEATVTIKPEVTLGQYKGLKAEKIDTTVTDEELDKELKKAQEQNARTISVEGRPAADGDVVSISYVGTIDGTEFSGGKSDGYDLTLGSNTFINGFEEQIVGHNIGDKFDVKVTFPEEYHAPELSGKEAVFAVEVKDISIKELPELNDEFAQDISEFETLNEYKESIVGKLKADKEAKAKQERSDKLLDQAVANTKMEVPPVMYENKVDQLVRDFEDNLGRQGLGLDVYCQYMGMTKEDIRNKFQDSAKKSVDARLMLEQIVKEENLSIEKEEVDKRIEEIGAGYGLKEGQMLEIIKNEDREALTIDMTIHKAIELIEDTAVEE